MLQRRTGGWFGSPSTSRVRRGSVKNETSARPHWQQMRSTIPDHPRPAKISGNSDSKPGLTASNGRTRLRLRAMPPALDRPLPPKQWRSISVAVSCFRRLPRCNRTSIRPHARAVWSGKGEAAGRGAGHEESVRRGGPGRNDDRGRPRHVCGQGGLPAHRADLFPTLGPNAVLERVAGLLRELAAAADAHLLAVGMGVPGLVDVGAGSRVSCRTLPPTGGTCRWRRSCPTASVARCASSMTPGPGRWES